MKLSYSHFTLESDAFQRWELRISFTELLDRLSHYAVSEGFMFFGSTYANPSECDGASWFFLEPIARARGYKNHSELAFFSESSSGEVEPNITTFTNPIGALNSILKLTGSSNSKSEPPLLAGTFGYELLHCFEEISTTREDKLGLPVYSLFLYRSCIEYRSGVAKCFNNFRTEDLTDQGICPLWNFELLPQQQLNKPEDLNRISSFSSKSNSVALGDFSSDTTQSYIAKVKEIKNRIREGLVYQVNLSQQFTLPTSSSGYELFLSLSRLHPAKFSAYINLGDSGSGSQEVISASPELFLSSESGIIRTSPIKGTRPRGKTPAEDLKLKEDLKSSPKDLAELAMIVDLERNDLGKVCSPKTITVETHGRLETLSHLHHLASDVSGRLSAENSLTEVLKAVFPSGSITGAPKIAAMNIISELETNTRGAYTGAIGWISSPKDFLLNVAIRTAILSNGRLVFNSGGGIVIDSDPEAEYQETMVKAQGLFEAWLACQ